MPALGLARHHPHRNVRLDTLVRLLLRDGDERNCIGAAPIGLGGGRDAR